MKTGKSRDERRPDPFENEQPEGYHYNRQERLSMQAAPRFPDRRAGLLRRNRTLLIILLDLVIILILGLFLMRYLYARVNTAELEGYSFILRGARYGEVVVATLEIENRRAESTFVSGSTPPASERTILRATVPALGASRVLYAEVRIGETVRRLSTGLEP
jgi:hypothetical protein